MVAFKHSFFQLLFGATALAKAALSLGIDGPVLVDGSSHLAIVTTLTNTGDETLEVLNDPETILSNLTTDSFFIKNVEGTSPEFVGHMVAYSAEKAMTSGLQEAFSTLKPGDSVKATHHLGQAYSFKGAGVGVYTVRARTAFQYRSAKTGDLLPIEADTEDHIVSVLLHVGDPLNDTNLNLERRATSTGCVQDAS